MQGGYSLFCITVLEGTLIIILRMVTAAAVSAVAAAGVPARAFVADNVHDYERYKRQQSRADQYRTPILPYKFSHISPH